MYEHPAQEAKWHVPGLQVKTVEQTVQFHTLQMATPWATDRSCFNCHTSRLPVRYESG